MTDSKTELHLEGEAKGLFNKARAISLEAPPYMQTRILAELRERQSRSWKLSLWRRLAVSCAAFGMGLLIWVSAFQSSGIFEAVALKPHVVRVEIKDLESELLAGAEISLPEGVSFYSEAFPELKEKRTLELAWEKGQKPFIPFVIQGDQTGIKEIKVKFLDSNRSVIAEKILKVRFMEKNS
jgi:hypothetical protein